MKSLFLSFVVASLFLSSFREARATVFYVSASTGNDTTFNGLDVNHPFQTVKRGILAMTAGHGDTLLLMNGTYVGSSHMLGIPSGVGTQANPWLSPTTIAAYPGHHPIVVAEPGQGAISFFGNSTIIIDGLTIDATGGVDGIKIARAYTTPDVLSHHIRIINTEIKNAPQQGILISDSPSGGVDHNEIIGCKIHDNGTTDFDHGIYVTSARNLIEKSEFYNNAGWGIHIYNGVNAIADYNVIRENLSHDNGKKGRGVGIGVHEGRGTLVYNNIIWSNPNGIVVDLAVTEAVILNNTIYDSVEYGITLGPSSSAVVVRNNIVQRSGFGSFHNVGTGNSESNNLFSGDAQFVDVLGRNFHLRTTSPAIDGGVFDSRVLIDFDGIQRPQGPSVDIGAYELPKSQTSPLNPPPNPPSNLKAF